MVNRSDQFIKWSRKLERLFDRKQSIKYNAGKIRIISYRPFVKKWLYYDRSLNDEVRQYYNKWGKENIAIITTGRGSSSGFSVFITNSVPDYGLLKTAQGFMRFNNEFQDDTSLISCENNNLNRVFTNKLGLSDDETFAYVYGLLNSPEYQQKYANDLKKDLARIPLVANKEQYVEIGNKLMNLHLNYEEVTPYSKVTIESKNNPSYVVKKMKFAKVRNPETGKLEKDWSTIIFNTDLIIKNIPEKAYEYVVNGRSAIEWIMDQYRVKTDKKSGITDDPNDFSDDPKYIFNLLLRIINVSVQTVDLVNSLPKLEIVE